jgi:hypothetical protein
VPDRGGPSECYVGHINRLGLDLGIRTGGIMAWAVIAPTNGVPHGALAGKYVGASGGYRWDSAQVQMFSSAGRTDLSRCSHSRSRRRPVSMR